VKTKHIVFSLLAVFAFASALFFNACKKDAVSETISQSASEIQNSEFTEGVLTFIDRCKNLTENPGLKDEDEIDVDVAVTNLEAAMNLMYTYYVKTSELYTATSEIVITVDQKNEMTESNIAQALEDLEDAVADDYGNAPYTNKKLIAVILEHEVNGSVHSIIATSITGNTTIPLYYNARDWTYGDGLGTCDELVPQIDDSDAAEQIEIAIDNLYYEEPPATGSYYWPNPTLEIISVTPENMNDYLNPDDKIIEDNHLDYIVFFNYSEHGNYDPSRCLLMNDEISFYKTKYIDRIDEICTGSIKLKSLDIVGKANSWGNDEYLNHDLYIVTGVRWVSYNQTYPQPI
jgi:hypothetical protein